MKAIVQTGYGLPEDVLRFDDVDPAGVDDDGVLVRVHAASVNIGDAHVTRGVPRLMRPVFRMGMAKNRVPGTDVAGTVEAVGEQVTRFQPGDEVFGWCKGAFAEYVSAQQDALTLKPTRLTFEQASAIGVSAFTALQALRDHGKIRPGHHVLIVGASGGVGTFGVQIAKAFGAEVTGVCSSRNLEMVTGLGADHVIDYTRDDFTKGEPRYDLILDNVGTHSLADTRRPLTPSGTVLPNGAPVGGWFGGLDHFAKALVSSIFVRGQGRPFVSMPNGDDLATLRDLAQSGTLTPVIDRTYPLPQAAEAVAHVAEGHARGKTVITV